LTAVILASGITAYNFAAAQFKNQLVLKCQALAATVATVIAEDSDGSAAFLKNMDTPKNAGYMTAFVTSCSKRP
jgi:hypothetical protein